MWGRCFSILLIILGLFKPPGHQKAGVTLAQQQGKNPLKTAHCSVSYSACLSAVPCCDLYVSALAGPQQPYSDCPHPCCVPAACPRQDYHTHLQATLRLRLPPLNSGWSASSLTSLASNSSGLWNLDYSPNLFNHTVLLFSPLYLLCQKPGTYLDEQYGGNSSHFVSLSSENTCYMYDLIIHFQWLHPMSGIIGIRISLPNV